MEYRIWKIAKAFYILSILVAFLCCRKNRKKKKHQPTNQSKIHRKANSLAVAKSKHAYERAIMMKPQIRGETISSNQFRSVFFMRFRLRL